MVLPAVVAHGVQRQFVLIRHRAMAVMVSNLPSRGRFFRMATVVLDIVVERQQSAARAVVAIARAEAVRIKVWMGAAAADAVVRRAAVVLLSFVTRVRIKG